MCPVSKDKAHDLTLSFDRAITILKFYYERRTIQNHTFSFLALSTKWTQIKQKLLNLFWGYFIFKHL